MKLITKYNKFLESIQPKDMWDIIPQSVKDLNELFKEHGKKLYLVGGSVRDFLTGDKPKDFDLATDALPDEVIDIVGKTYRTNLQGKAFGVVVVFTKEVPEGMEIATFREDVSKGRNPEVKLGVTIEDDVKRRDLTYNSLFYDLDKREIVDLVGGKSDLEAGITRMVGDPIERFDEDSLRILRSFRFSSRYEHPLHKDTEAAIAKRKQLENIDLETGEMKRISQERIWEEVKKAFKQAKDFNFYLNFFTKFDMWDQVFPGSNINTDLIKSSDFVVVIANLFKNERLNGLETKLVQDYKIESDTAKKVMFLLNMLSMKVEDVFQMFKKKEQCFITDTTISEWLNVNKISDFRVETLKFKPSINSKKLMDQGFIGKSLGIKINELEIEKFKEMIKKRV